MEMSKVFDNDDDREQTTLNRKTHFYLSLKLRQAWNQIKLNKKKGEKMLLRNECGTSYS